MYSTLALTLFLLAILSLAHSTDTQSLLQLDSRQDGELAYSPPIYPSPWMDPQAAGWQDAYAKAQQFVSQLTLLEKVNLTTGVG